MGLTTTAFGDLRKTVSLDPYNKDIQSKLGKVVLLFSSTIKGTRKLDDFDHPEGSRVCFNPPVISKEDQLQATQDQQLNNGGSCTSAPAPAVPGGRNVDSPCTGKEMRSL